MDFLQRIRTVTATGWGVCTDDDLFRSCARGCVDAGVDRHDGT